MLATPDTPPLREYPTVYPPSEDTYLLLDILETQLPNLIPQPLLAIEIGSGSGVVSTFIKTLLPFSLVLSTDINPAACKCTQATASLNGKKIESVQTKFTQSIKHPFDLIVFNPPYVVTAAEEVFQLPKTDFEISAAAWAGGIDGRQVVDVFLDSLDTILSSNGVCFVVAVRENNVDDMISYVEEKNADITGEVVEWRRCGSEKLCVIKYKRI